MVFWSRAIFFSNEKPTRLSENSSEVFSCLVCVWSGKSCPSFFVESCARRDAATMANKIRLQTTFAARARTWLDSFRQNLAAIAADVPIEEIVVAVCIRVFHFWFCPTAFSGTTTMSPGCKATPNGFPLNHPSEDCPPTIDPLARMTKMAFLSASWLGPPAWAKYQFAFRPGL